MPEKIIFKNPREEAVAEITVLQQEVAQMGANDMEHLALEALKNSLLNNKITPDEALREALAIKNGKQDYH